MGIGTLEVLLRIILGWFIIFSAFVFIIFIIYKKLYLPKDKKHTWYIIVVMTKNGERLVLELHQLGKVIGAFTDLEEANQQLSELSKKYNIPLKTENDHMY